MTAAEFKQHESRIYRSAAMECLARAFKHLAHRSRGDQGNEINAWRDRGDHLAPLLIARLHTAIGREDLVARAAEIQKGHTA